MQEVKKKLHNIITLVQHRFIRIAIIVQKHICTQNEKCDGIMLLNVNNIKVSQIIIIDNISGFFSWHKSIKNKKQVIIHILNMVFTSFFFLNMKFNTSILFYKNGGLF